MSFEFNQLSIIEEFCVNKEKPELNCDGKCYLSEQLNKTSKEKDPEAPAPEIKENNIQLYPIAISSEIDESVINLSTDLRSEEFILPEGYSTSLFHPPEMA